MHVGDITTKSVKAVASGSYMVVLEREWLEHCGFTQKELDGGEIAVVFKAELSENKKFPYIGFGKPRKV